MELSVQNFRFSKNPSYTKEALKVRQEVFVIEQKVSADNEIDNVDFDIHQKPQLTGDGVLYQRTCTNTTVDSAGYDTVHLLILANQQEPTTGTKVTYSDSTKAQFGVGTARIYNKNIRDASVLKIGRLAVLKEWRGFGIGRQLMRKADEIIRHVAINRKHDIRVELHAQSGKLEFYKSLGYIVDPYHPEPFLEEGIEHYSMFKYIRLE